MGEAKRRGTYEQRKATAIERDLKLKEISKKNEQQYFYGRRHGKSILPILISAGALGALNLDFMNKRIK